MEDYKPLFSEIIKGHMKIAGPTVGLSVARKTGIFTIADDGNVLASSENPQQALEHLVEAYGIFFGATSKIILRSILEKHPDITLKGI